MKKLYLLRHAKSSWADAGLRDYDRPLNERGRREAEAMGGFFQEQSFKIDRILCSGALRTRQTLELLLRSYDYGGEIEYMDDIYASSPAILKGIIRRQDCESLLLVGHNPELEELVFELSRQSFEMRTCHLAVIDMEDGRLEIFVGPPAKA